MFSVEAVVPAYNAGRYIEEAVRSVWNQTMKPERLIVVDDGSVDCTPEILSRLQQELSAGWLHLIRQENSGLSAARNAGIRACRAQYVALLDADDVWMPGKLDAQLAVLTAALGRPAGLVYCDFEQIDEDGRTVQGPRFQLNRRARGDVRRLLGDANCIAGSGSGVLVRRDLFEIVGGFDTQLRSAEDWDMWQRLAEVTHFDFVPQALVKIRRHSLSMQADPMRMFDGELALFAKQYVRGSMSRPHLARLRRLVAVHRLDVRTVPSAASIPPVVMDLFRGRAFGCWCAAYRATLALRRSLKSLVTGQ